MKFIISITLTALLGFAAPLYFAWWSFAITSALVALLVKQKGWLSFFSGFLGLLFLWGGLSFFIDLKNEHLLSNKIASILPLGGSYWAIIAATALTGALVSGFAALTGSLAGKLKKA